MQLFQTQSNISRFMCFMALLLTTSVVLADDQNYDNVSLVGTYATAGIGRGGSSPVAGMTILKADGRGRLTGTTMLNAPSAKNGGRRLIRFPVSGSYQVNPDGSGKFKLLPPAEIGEPETGRLMITRAWSGKKSKRVFATEVFFVVDKLLPESKALLTTVAKRVPQRPDLDASALEGTYASSGISSGGTSPIVGASVIYFDGKGNVKGTSFANSPSSNPGERQLSTINIFGRYEINGDGTGVLEILEPTDSRGRSRVAQFIVTQSKPSDTGTGHVATEVWAISDQVFEGTGALQTSVLKRRLN